MGKPLYVSLAGWMFLTLMTLATGNGIVGSSALTGHPPMSAEWTGLCILVALPCLMIWMFGTTLYHVSRKRMALIQEELQRRASAQTGARLEQLHTALPTVAAGAKGERR